ncbi:hypothetical protein CJU90_1041 [Yarrowia sp. C11]|nr:hypothetical protein CKK34_2454 [Yarrowia sp. E02]KAG5373347.1 hypothetical protein CJU90_1041 [Yarrowia sp. C11]
MTAAEEKLADTLGETGHLSDCIDCSTPAKEDSLPEGETLVDRVWEPPRPSVSEIHPKAVSSTKAPVPASSTKPAASPAKLVISLVVLLCASLTMWFYPTGNASLAPNHPFDFRPQKTYSKTEKSTAFADFNCPQRMKRDESNNEDLADLVVFQIWNNPETAHEHVHMFNQGEADIPIRLHNINSVMSCKGDSKDTSCEHLKTALYETFSLLEEGFIPSAQCVSAQDSKNNSISFIWGQDHDEILATKCDISEQDCALEISSDFQMVYSIREKDEGRGWVG